MWLLQFLIRSFGPVDGAHGHLAFRPHRFERLHPTLGSH